MDLLRRFTDYLNSPQNKLSNKTVKNYKADTSSFISWYKKQYNQELGITPTNITSQIVDLYKRAKIQESNLSGNSLKRHLSSLRRFFQFLKTEGIISQDPFEQMKNLLKNTLIMQDKWHLQAFKNYLYFYNKSNLTVKNYILDARHFLTWIEQVTMLTDAKNATKENVVSKINDTLVNEYKKRLLEHGFSPRTINRKLSSIRKYLNWATTEGLMRNSELESPPIFNLEKPQSAAYVLKNYSSFPPLRLMQKTLRGIGFIFDISLIVPLIKLTDALKPKPIFSGVIPNFTPRSKSVVLPSIPHISAIPKGFYAPLSISTRYFPLHKKIWHYMRHKRPDWYKKYHSHSIIHYFHLSFLIISMSILGFAIYQNLNLEQQKEKSVLSSFVNYSPRILSFNGQLTDNSNSPITSTDTPLRIAIYNDETATGSALLWEEIVSVNPDSEGKFLAFLGNNTAIPQSLFSQNQALWLGVAIGESPELTPREPVANVTFASNAKTLQGLPPITSQDADTKNVVLALDSSGNLTIDGNANPTFQATGGTFKLLGETLLLSTTPGTNTNVVIAPTDLGKIDLQKPIFNSTDNNNVNQAIGAVEIDDSLAVLATNSAQAAFTINQTSTGELISAYKSGTAKFTIDNNGDIISEAGSKWKPFSNSTSALNIADATGNAFVSFDTTNSRVLFLQDTTERGAVFYLNSDSTFHMRSASGLALDTNNSNTPRVYIATSGNVGIGTTNPSLRLDVQDEKAASATAQIFNTNTGADADGLILKLGNTSTTAVGNANHFISFETSGIGIVGSVQGNGGTNVAYVTNGIADFAEYLKKDESQTIEYGSVVCIDEKGLVLPCDQTNNKIIGLSSEHPGFLGGENLGNKSIAVGLVGQVHARVSAINGNIKPGDPLTSSSISGVAVKAISAGPIVGKALEALECCEGKILVSISVSWYDPSIYISETGNLLTQKTETPKLSTIISPIPEIDEIHTDIISPLASAPPTDLPAPQSNITLEIQNASGSAVTTIDSLENASSSGSLNAEIIDTKTLQSPNIHTFPEGLIVFGPTSLNDTSIIGQLSIGAQGGRFIITQNSINAIGAVLELQPLRQGALSIMGGLVYIDTNGDLKVDGNAEFAKDVKVGGDIIASGSGTFSKLNLSIAKNALALSSKELIATGSAGTAFVRAREVEVTINNNLVTDNSLIYITPAGTPSGQIPFLLRQAPETSFTVGIASASAKNTPFNWLIIN